MMGAMQIPQADSFQKRLLQQAGHMPSTRGGGAPAGGRGGVMTSSERWKAMAKSIVYSPYVHVYYAGMIGINIFALAYSFHAPDQAPQLLWFIALETLITAGLVVEVVLRCAADGSSLFFHAWSNLFDLMVMVLCILALVAFICTPALTETMEEDFALLIRATRDAIRMLRLIFLCKNSRHSHTMQDIQPVTLRMAAADISEHSESERDALIMAEQAPRPAASSFSFSLTTPVHGRRQVAINELQDITSGAFAGASLGGQGGVSGSSWMADTPPQTPTVHALLPAQQPLSPLLAPLSPRW